MRQCKINFIEREKIANRYAAGESIGDLAKEYGVNTSTISYILREKNVEIRPQQGRPKKFSNDFGAIVRKEYETGATTYELAEKYGTTKKTIAEYIREAGGTLRPRGLRKAS